MKAYAIVAFLSLVSFVAGYDLIYAVNFGGKDEFVDSQGIVYAPDTTDYSHSAFHLEINDVPTTDQPLYQSYAYAINSMTFPITNITESGKYLLVIKTIGMSPERRFDAWLNDHLRVIADKSVYETVGKYGAYDEYVYFTVCNGKLLFKKETSDILSAEIGVTFEKKAGPNVPIAAMALLRGDDVENYPILHSPVSRLLKDGEISLIYQRDVHTCEAPPTQEEAFEKTVIAMLHRILLNLPRTNEKQ